MKKVTILRGIPGSGKSTRVAQLRAKHAAQWEDEFVVCSADDFFVSEGVYRFDPAGLPGAHAYCLRRFAEAITDGGVGHVVVDNTNSSAVEVSPYANLAIAYSAAHRAFPTDGVELEVVTLIASDPIAVAQRNVHGVPLKVCLQMHQRLLTDILPPWWADRWVVVGPGYAA